MNRNELHNKVTQMMIDSLGENQAPWRKPYSSTSNVSVVSTNTGAPCNFHSGRRYTGINPLLLSIASQHYGYQSKHWGTDKSWMNNLGAVAEGHATHIILFAFVPKRDKSGKVQTNKAGEKITFPLLREFPLFNVAQVHSPTVDNLLDGRCGKKTVSVIKSLLKEEGARSSKSTKDELLRIAKRYVKGKNVDNLTRREIAEEIHDAIETRINQYTKVSLIKTNPDFAPAENFIKSTGANILNGKIPQYHRDSNIEWITIPPKENFDSTADYYDTLFHELCHWGEQRVGYKSIDYDFCELVAEIGACFLMMEIGVPMSANIIEQSKAYVKSWLRGMNTDARFIFEASKQASKVVNYLLSLNNNSVERAA